LRGASNFGAWMNSVSGEATARRARDCRRAVYSSLGQD
jgi:hypothetical protein